VSHGECHRALGRGLRARVGRGLSGVWFYVQLRGEITGKRMIITHLSNHTLGVIITVHDILHLGVKITSL